MTAAAKDPVMDRKMSQLRDGSLIRIFGIPSIRRAGFCLGAGLGSSGLGAGEAGGAPLGGDDMFAMMRSRFLVCKTWLLTVRDTVAA